MKNSEKTKDYSFVEKISQAVREEIVNALNDIMPALDRDPRKKLEAIIEEIETGQSPKSSKSPKQEGMQTINEAIVEAGYSISSIKTNLDILTNSPEFEKISQKEVREKTNSEEREAIKLNLLNNVIKIANNVVHRDFQLIFDGIINAVAPDEKDKEHITATLEHNINSSPAKIIDRILLDDYSVGQIENINKIKLTVGEFSLQDLQKEEMIALSNKTPSLEEIYNTIEDRNRKIDEAVLRAEAQKADLAQQAAEKQLLAEKNEIDRDFIKGLKEQISTQDTNITTLKTARKNTIDELDTGLTNYIDTLKSFMAAQKEVVTGPKTPEFDNDNAIYLNNSSSVIKSSDEINIEGRFTGVEKIFTNLNDLQEQIGSIKEKEKTASASQKEENAKKIEDIEEKIRKSLVELEKPMMELLTTAKEITDQNKMRAEQEKSVALKNRSFGTKIVDFFRSIMGKKPAIAVEFDKKIKALDKNFKDIKESNVSKHQAIDKIKDKITGINGYNNKIQKAQTIKEYLGAELQRADINQHPVVAGEKDRIDFITESVQRIRDNHHIEILNESSLGRLGKINNEMAAQHSSDKQQVNIKDVLDSSGPKQEQNQQR